MCVCVCVGECDVPVPAVYCIRSLVLCVRSLGIRGGAQRMLESERSIIFTFVSVLERYSCGLQSVDRICAGSGTNLLLVD